MLQEIRHYDRNLPVLVIGGAGVDIVGRIDGELHLGVSNHAVIRHSYGGVARNVAENLARLGQCVKLITAVGTDRSGDMLLADLVNAGVDISAVLRCPEHPTGLYLAAINGKGEFQVGLDDMHAVSSITPDYIEEHFDSFKQASMLFLDANLSPKTLRKVFSLARRAKIPVCADPTSANLVNRLCPHISQLHIIVPNSTEAGILCDREVDASEREIALEVAKQLVSQGVEIVIVTLAQFGVCYATSETNGYVSAMHTPIVDPTGGGDAFTAAVLFALLNEIPLDDAVRLGISAASLTLRHIGTVIPDLSLEKLYDCLVI